MSNKRIRNELSTLSNNKSLTVVYKNNNLDFIYKLLLINKNQDKIPPEVFRDNILPFINVREVPKTHLQNMEYMIDKYDISNLYIQTICQKKIYTIHFNIPREYPFKPPKFWINNICGSRIKDLGDIHNVPWDDYKKIIYSELCYIYDEYFYNSWSPMNKLESCIEQIQHGLEIHNNLDWTSGLLKLIKN